MIRRTGTGGIVMCLALVTTLWSVGGTVLGQDVLGLDQGKDSRIDYQAELPPAEAVKESGKKPFEPPLEEAIPDDQYGAMVHLRHQIFVDTQTYASDSHQPAVTIW